MANKPPKAFPNPRLNRQIYLKNIPTYTKGLLYDILQHDWNGCGPLACCTLLSSRSLVCAFCSLLLSNKANLTLKNNRSHPPGAANAAASGQEEAVSSYVSWMADFAPEIHLSETGDS